MQSHIRYNSSCCSEDLVSTSKKKRTATPFQASNHSNPHPKKFTHIYLRIAEFATVGPTQLPARFLWFHNFFNGSSRCWRGRTHWRRRRRWCGHWRWHHCNCGVVVFKITRRKSRRFTVSESSIAGKDDGLVKEQLVRALTKGTAHAIAKRVFVRESVGHSQA